MFWSFLEHIPSVLLLLIHVNCLSENEDDLTIILKKVVCLSSELFSRAECVNDFETPKLIN